MYILLKNYFYYKFIKLPNNTELAPTPLKQFSYPFHLAQFSFSVKELLLIAVQGQV